MHACFHTQDIPDATFTPEEILLTQNAFKEYCKWKGKEENDKSFSSFTFLP